MKNATPGVFSFSFVLNTDGVNDRHGGGWQTPRHPGRGGRRREPQSARELRRGASGWTHPQRGPDTQDGRGGKNVDVVAKVFPGLMKSVNLRIQEGQHPPSARHRKETPRTRGTL